jgi:hypothetical protein
LQSGGCSSSVRLDFVNDTKLPKMKLLNQTSPSFPGSISQIKNTYLGSSFGFVLGRGNGKRGMGNGKSSDVTELLTGLTWLLRSLKAVMSKF